MNPQQPNQYTEQPASKPHKKLALTLLIAPTALFILALLLAIVAGQIADLPAQDGELFGQTSPVKQVLNILAFVCGGVGFMTWLPGLIIGIVLLAKKR